MTVVYRDKHGVEYESVPLPTSEVTDAVPLDARKTTKRAVKEPVPVYDGTDGGLLAQQPHRHRRHWTDEQWGAYEEYRRFEAKHSKSNAPVASAVVVKSKREPAEG